MPPTTTPYFSDLFRGAAKCLGYHPYNNATAVTSQEYTNPDGVTRPACTFCGFCERTPCMIGAKAQPTSVLMPILQKRKSVALRTGATVRRIVHDKTANGGKARGVTYVDESGEEVFQPADLVFLSSYTLGNNHLLFLSNIGTPYDPATDKGTLGKNLTHQLAFGVQAFLPKPLNRFMGGGGTGVRIADFDADVFDHGNLPFIRGGMIGAMSVGTQPLSTFGNVPNSMKLPRWGAAWKKAAIEWYDQTGVVAFAGEQIPYRGNRFDLDPTYKNPLGDPLLRMTINWQDNERKMVEFMNAKMVELARAMGAKEVNPCRALRGLRRDALPVHAHSGRHHDGHVPGPRRGKHSRPALGRFQSLRPGRLHVPQFRLVQSHAHDPGADLPHRRRHRGKIFEKAGNARVVRS